jgi:hypothetical protein
VDAAIPAAGAAFSFHELRNGSFDMLFSRIFFFDRLGPANPLIPRKGRNVFPSSKSLRFGLKSFSKIRREFVDGTVGDFFFWHTVILADSGLSGPQPHSHFCSSGHIVKRLLPAFL